MHKHNPLGYLVDGILTFNLFFGELVGAIRIDPM